MTLSPLTGHASQIVTIPQIQGVGHVSPVDGALVQFEGVVTLLRDSSFFVQDSAGDGNDATSDGILVRRKPSALAVGDRVKVEGFVDESGRPGQFSTTTINDPVFRKMGTAPVPAPVTIGAGGRQAPTETIVLPTRGFDPLRSGADFFETLEGMLVRIEAPLVVGPAVKKDRTHVFHVVSDGGRHTTGMNSLGGITATPGDPNPERIQVQVGKPLLPADFQVAIGDRYSELVGAVTTDNAAYGIQLGRADSYAPKNWTIPAVEANDPDTLTIAGYNVENLDTQAEKPENVPADDGQNNNRDDDMAAGKFARIATHIVELLRSPDVVALQEVQDNDGGEYSEVVAADKTLGALVEAVAAAGGPTYSTLVRDPADDEEGGQPGGNIRVAFLFNAARVSVDEAAIERIEDPSFARTRLPLAAPFKFRDKEFLVINVHLSSKSGSDPLYGTVQPPSDRTAGARTGQARAIRDFIRKLPPGPSRSVVVLGDFNTFWYEEPLLLLTSGEPSLKNMAIDEPPLERVSYVFDGNSQSLDHVLVGLADGLSATMSTLHVNSVFPEEKQVSDHDPKHLRIQLVE